MGVRISVTALVVLLLTPGAAMAQKFEQDPPDSRATAAVQVTKNPDPVRAHAAPLVDVHPQSGELTIIEIEGRSTRACSVHISPDGGRRWFSGGDPTLEPYTDCASDPVWSNNAWITFADDGTLYVAFIAHDPGFNHRGRGGLPRNVFLARSTDAGRSFDTTMVYEAPEEVDDEVGDHTNRLPQVAVDPSDSLRVYVSWQQGGFTVPNPALIAASNNGGESFGEPVDLAEGVESARTPRITVDGAGVVHAAVPINDEPRRVYYRRSTDHGQTWSDPFELQSKEPGLEDDEDVDMRRNRKWRLEADPNSARLYFVWYGAVDPAATLDDTSNNIYLQVSPDGGRSWKNPVLVNDDSSDEANQYDPNISIAPNGRLDIAWLDFRNSPYPENDLAESPWNHGGFQDVYYSYSTDGGETLSRNVRISDRLINREIGVWSNRVHMHGHVGLTSTDDTVYFAWQDSRNGAEKTQAEDVYFASYLMDDAEPMAAGASGARPPLWVVAGVALFLGMGIAMQLSWVVARRTRSTRQGLTAG